VSSAVLPGPSGPDHVHGRETLEVGDGHLEGLHDGLVLFFLSVAAGYGVLAVSYSRRFGLGKGVVVRGALGAPVALGVILLGVPMLLSALGVMPAP
jgi:hypothetical protein